MSRTGWFFLAIASAAFLAAAATELASVPHIGSLAISAGTITIAGLLTHQAAGIHPRHLSIPGIWFLAYTGLITIPAHWVAAVFGYGEATDRFLIAVRAGLLATAVGLWLTTRALGRGRGDWTQHLKRPVSLPRKEDWPFALAFGVAALMALSLTLQYVREVPDIPLWHMITHPGDYLALTLLREESLKLLDSPFRYAYYLLQSFGFPLLTTISWGMYRVSGSRAWLGTTVAVGAGAVFFASLSLAKAPVAFVVLLLLFTHYLFVGGRFSTRVLITGAVLFLGFPLVVVVASTDTAGVPLSYALEQIALRIFYDPAVTLYYYFDVVPHFVDFQGGRTVGMLMKALGGTPFPIENAVALIGEGATVASANSNAAFVGNLYVDWGFTGVILGSLLAGGLLGTAHSILTRLSRTPVTIAVTAHLMLSAILLSATSLPTVLMSSGGLLAPLSAIGLVALARAIGASASTFSITRRRASPSQT